LIKEKPNDGEIIKQNQFKNDFKQKNSNKKDEQI
jgi:hypothetical protein